MTESPGRWRDTLQARLVGSFFVVISIALGLVTFLSILYLRRYERTAEEQRLAQLAVPLIAEVNAARIASERGALRGQLRIAAIDAQAEALDLRILVLDTDGTVRYDSSAGDGLRETALPAYAGAAASVVAAAQADGKLHYEAFGPRRASPFPGKRVVVAASQTGALRARRAIVIVSDARRFPLLRIALPRLAIVVGASLVLASALAYLFSRRIAGPVHRLTTAANAIASGHLEQRVEPSGEGELDRLIASFNEMSRRVATTHRSQRTLLANVAHELRTPLTSVQGYAQALRDGAVEPGPEAERVLATIDREAERMSVLIAQLLDLSRLESGQSPIARRPIDAASLVERSLERFRPAAKAKGVLLAAQVTPDVAISGDEGRLLQVLSNLLDNAIRHTPAGGLVHVAVETAGDHVRIVVHDTGEGIAAKRLPGIFDRFTRGEPAEGQRPGFGLGLAIVKELVTLHGGTVSVTSDVGRETTVTVMLPAA